MKNVPHYVSPLSHRKSGATVLVCPLCQNGQETVVRTHNSLNNNWIVSADTRERGRLLLRSKSFGGTSRRDGPTRFALRDYERRAPFVVLPLGSVRTSPFLLRSSEVRRDKSGALTANQSCAARHAHFSSNPGDTNIERRTFNIQLFNIQHRIFNTPEPNAHQ